MSEEQKDLTGLFPLTDTPAHEAPPSDAVTLDPFQPLSNDLEAIGMEPQSPAQESIQPPDNPLEVDPSFEAPPSEAATETPIETPIQLSAEPSAAESATESATHSAPELAPTESVTHKPPTPGPNREPLPPPPSETAKKEAVPAAFPFSILIKGELSAAEKEKLVDLINRENMGIREIFLEPQFETKKILIPRISEYAAILIVQTLRTIEAEIQLGPSDTIFSTPDTQEDSKATEQTFAHPAKLKVFQNTPHDPHPAENLPITSGTALPQFPHFILLDTLTASAILRTYSVETESSGEFEDILESLQRKMKYKAYHKGANGITCFKYQLQRLSSPAEYRLIVSGSAIQNQINTAPQPLTDFPPLDNEPESFPL